MKWSMDEVLKLYLVTKEDMHIDILLKKVEEAVKGGVTMVQLREKNSSSHEFYNKAIRLKELLISYKIPLIINDRVDIALAIEADGIHVGQSDLPAKVVKSMIPDGMILGVSARTIEEATRAKMAGAHYIGVGACFPTSTKNDAKLIHHDLIKEINTKVNIPSVGIGGITMDNVENLSHLGLNGVAVISAILNAENTTLAAQSITSKFES
ncbi:thiamine phosphate synthase [Cytobacillus sp. FJAT-54145]|uniref:Thiamine-phosphate synthase n=1 Tax=Cytobacillus spartinae TaxID=3299023 RepID=A0ABW6KBX8_9BACI